MNQLKEALSTILIAAIGTGGKETALSSSIAAAGVVVSGWLGGWDKALQVLLLLMLVDYVTGVLGAIKTKLIDSEVMFWGGVRKITVLFVIGLAALMDDWVQPGVPIFRTAAVYFYAGREGLSVIENLGTIGVPLPGKLKQFLAQLSDKGETKNGNG
ncbi:phage holin family protein [Paenibacillus sp. 2TAB19]|uniref:phage holin family protein n=1 Tax=Paenibacillus sp. 2TAB19 TaxID=3233003 RepID=UPI003F99757D